MILRLISIGILMQSLILLAPSFAYAADTSSNDETKHGAGTEAEAEELDRSKKPKLDGLSQSAQAEFNEKWDAATTQEQLDNLAGGVGELEAKQEKSVAGELENLERRATLLGGASGLRSLNSQTFDDQQNLLVEMERLAEEYKGTKYEEQVRKIFYDKILIHNDKVIANANLLQKKDPAKMSEQERATWGNATRKVLEQTESLNRSVQIIGLETDKDKLKPAIAGLKEQNSRFENGGPTSSSNIVTKGVESIVESAKNLITKAYNSPSETLAEVGKALAVTPGLTTAVSSLLTGSISAGSLVTNPASAVSASATAVGAAATSLIQSVGSKNENPFAPIEWEGRETSSSSPSAGGSASGGGGGSSTTSSTSNFGSSFSGNPSGGNWMAGPATMPSPQSVLSTNATAPNMAGTPSMTLPAPPSSPFISGNSPSGSVDANNSLAGGASPSSNAKSAKSGMNGFAQSKATHGSGTASAGKGGSDKVSSSIASNAESTAAPITAPTPLNASERSRAAKSADESSVVSLRNPSTSSTTKSEGSTTVAASAQTAASNPVAGRTAASVATAAAPVETAAARPTTETAWSSDLSNSGGKTAEATSSQSVSRIRTADTAGDDNLSNTDGGKSGQGAGDGGQRKVGSVSSASLADGNNADRLEADRENNRELEELRRQVARFEERRNQRGNARGIKASQESSDTIATFDGDNAFNNDDNFIASYQPIGDAPKKSETDGNSGLLEMARTSETSRLAKVAIDQKHQTISNGLALLESTRGLAAGVAGGVRALRGKDLGLVSPPRPTNQTMSNRQLPGTAPKGIAGRGLGNFSSAMNQLSELTQSTKGVKKR